MKYIITHTFIVGLGIILFWWRYPVLEDAMGFSLAWLYFILPLSEFVLSYYFGKSVGNEWKYKHLLFCSYFGLSYMAMEYVTFSLANMIAFHKFDPKTMLYPDPVLFLLGFITSLGAYLLGIGKVKRMEKRRRGNAPTANS